MVACQLLFAEDWSRMLLVVGGVCLLHLWEFGSPNPVRLSMYTIIQDFNLASTDMFNRHRLRASI